MTPPEPVRLAFVGDLVPARQLPTPLPLSTERVFDLLRSADLAVGDLEMPMTTRGTPQEKPIAFRGSPDLAAVVPETGLRVLSLATNHSMDQGPDALLDTIEALGAVGVATTGAGRDLEAAEQLLVLMVGGLRVGLLAWSCLLPVGASATAVRAGIAPLRIHTTYEIDPYLQLEEPGGPPVVRTAPDRDDLARVTAAVSAAREEVDLLVVSMHWGFGSTGVLAEYQPMVGRELVEAGADLVVGAHVHAVQAVEVHRGRAIVYGLGNFLAQQPREGLSAAALRILDEMSRDAAAAVVQVRGDGTLDVALTALTTGDDGLPELAGGALAERIVSGVVEGSAQRGTNATVEADGVVRVQAHWGRQR